MAIFDGIRGLAPRRSKFDLSHERKFSFNMGDLVPILCEEILPGDSFRVNTEVLLRLAPMIAPMMHRVNVFTHYYFVPNRLVWNEWEPFITGGEDGKAAPVWPNLYIDDGTKANIYAGTLADFFRVPSPDPAVAITNPITFSQLPFRAYQLIYNEYYRDQNLTPKVTIPLQSGNIGGAGNVEELLKMRKRAWEKDYFTSALPWAQRGDTVLIPNSSALKMPAKGYSSIKADGTGDVPALDGPMSTANQGTITNSANQQPMALDTLEGINITIADLRKSARLQEFLELTARAGSRYVEYIKAFFGIKSSDARLQRPEYLGGGRAPIVISEVLSNFQQVGGEIPQGNMAGHGISVGNQNGFKRDFEEHGYVIGIMSVLPKTAYQQGLPRHLSRSDKFDYYNQKFANIGEQPVKVKELYHGFELGNGVTEGTFGYQSRYCEYKYGISSVHGEFKNNLAFWHMGRIFAGPPALNTSFVESDPTTRIFAVEDDNVSKMYCQLYNSVSAIRPMSYYDTPSL